ncbi:helix-turn-helix domain-containing protein [Patescibacteria group bacterium]|nr:helix-turn-helix domain-containing protein [Patescibacteria group bacterium]
MKKQQIKKIKELDLTIFEAKLQAMAENGAFDDAMEESLDRLVRETKPAELTSSELNHFYQTVKKASGENAIMDARTETPVTDLPLGRFLQLVRDRSGLSHAQVGIILNKDASFVERIENGQINPLNLMANEVADIMLLFKLSLTEFINSVKIFLSISHVKKGKINAMARSSIKAGSIDKGNKLAHAMDAVLQAIVKKSEKKIDEIKINPDYLEAIKQALKKRGAQNLLK